MDGELNERRIKDEQRENVLLVNKKYKQIEVT